MRLFLIACPLAVAISYALIAIMAWMVDLSFQQDSSDNTPLSFDIFIDNTDEQSQRIKRVLPDPPTEKPQPPKPDMATTPPQVPSPPALTTPLPEVSLDLSVQGMQISTPVIAKTQPVENIPAQTLPATPAPVSDTPVFENQIATPQYRMEPKYPHQALKRRIQGFVLLSFDINSKGRPKNIKIIDAQPPRIFNREAMRALKSWKYQPLIINGQAQVYPNQQVKLEFKIK